MPSTVQNSVKEKTKNNEKYKPKNFRETYKIFRLTTHLKKMFLIMTLLVQSFLIKEIWDIF